MAKKIEHMFIRFGRIRERDRQTDRQTCRQTPHDGIDRAYAQHREAKMAAFRCTAVILRS